jgi:S-adenosylmethionine hydrolase
MRPIVLFTDFGLDGPYLGQVKVVLAREAPGVAVFDLLADAPAFDPQASAYLLAALAPFMPTDAVFVAVVDPGVGDPRRRPAAVQVDGQWFVGPDKGLFNVVAQRGREVAWFDITWQPPRLSASFHGRDLFAPVAARIAQGQAVPGMQVPAHERIDAGWPHDLARIVYIDRYGNAMTGLRVAHLAPGARLRVDGVTLLRGRTFSDVPRHEALWYENSNGLAEIAVNGGSAAARFGLAVGSAVEIVAA